IAVLLGYVAVLLGYVAVLLGRHVTVLLGRHTVARLAPVAGLDPVAGLGCWLAFLILLVLLLLGRIGAAADRSKQEACGNQQCEQLLHRRTILSRRIAIESACFTHPRWWAALPLRCASARFIPEILAEMER